MLLFPYKKLVVYSELTTEVLTGQLRQSIEPYTGFRFDNYSKSSKPFVGKLGHQTFDIRPVFEGRNAFIPKIHGRIEEFASASKVTVTMRLHYSVVLFLLWIIGLIIYALLKYKETSSLLVVLFCYVLTIGFFNVEYRKTKNTLLNLLQAKADTTN